MIHFGTTVVISVLVLVFGYCYYVLKSTKKFPPGPRGIPLLGNLLSLQPQFHLSFDKWAKQYGPVVGIKVGQYRAVILDDVKVIREALNQHAFAGRPDLRVFNFYAGGKHGLFNSEGPEWVEQRRFTLRKLRGLGFGKVSMESLIMDEVNDVLDWIKASKGMPVSVNRKFSVAVVNALLGIMTGNRHDHENSVFKNILDNDFETFGAASRSIWMLFMPTLSKWFPQFWDWDSFEKTELQLRSFFKDIVQSRADAVANGSEDFLNVYLEKIDKTTDSSSSFYQECGIKTLATVMTDLFVAGSGTTTTILAWMILYLLKHPEVQLELQLELDHVTGRQRIPCLADRPDTPFTEAVILETLRFATINPFSGLHSTTEDVEFHGYYIPKDTVIIPNLYGVHRDEKIWGDPEKFRPSRFLVENEEGQALMKSDSLVAFSVGKRVCIGETLARDQLYLFLTNTLYKFRVLPDPADPNPSLQPEGTFSLEPKPYTVVFRDRLQE